VAVDMPATHFHSDPRTAGAYQTRRRKRGRVDDRPDRPTHRSTPGNSQRISALSFAPHRQEETCSSKTLIFLIAGGKTANVSLKRLLIQFISNIKDFHG
jgi:hypothetical protein